MIPTLFVAGCYVLVYKCWQFYNRYKKYGNLKKPPKDGIFKDIIKEAIGETAHKELPLKLKKIYEKKNRKLLKRGRSEMTPKDFMEYLYKQERNLKIGNWIVLLVYIGLYLFGVVSMVLDSDTTWNETFGFGAFMAVYLGVIYFLYIKFINIGIYTKRILIRECEEKGITVLDIAQQIEEEDKEEI